MQPLWHPFGIRQWATVDPHQLYTVGEILSDKNVYKERGVITRIESSIHHLQFLLVNERESLEGVQLTGSIGVTAGSTILLQSSAPTTKYSSHNTYFAALSVGTRCGS